MDLAAVCFERALGEWISLALSTQVSEGSGLADHGRASGVTASTTGSRLDDAIALEYMIQLTDWRLEPGWAWLGFAAQGQLADALCRSGLSRRLEARLHQASLRALTMPQTRHARGLQLIRPTAASLPFDSPALLCLLERLEGRSRMLAWSRQARFDASVKP
jgi:hypothetical protein